MKYLTCTLMASILVISAISCKDRSSEKFPRDGYSLKTEGTVMRAAPDLKSEIVDVIPFAEKVTLTESSDPSKTASAGNPVWYKTSWNEKNGWIENSSVGNMESLPEQIKKSFDEQKSGFSGEFVKIFESSPVSIKEKYVYPAGEMESAKMFFLNNGVMVLNSKLFSEKFSNTFFGYEFLNDGKLLKIKFADPKLDFKEYSSMENSSGSVFKIDINERVIIYHIKDNSFFFFNWGFFKE